MGRMTILILLLLYLNTGTQAGSKVKLLENIAGIFQKSDTALGAFSRSKIVNAISRSQRGEDPESVQESLNQAIVTLSVLDVGGGVLVPLTSQLVDVITKDRAFTSTVNALKEYGDPMVNKLDDLRNLDDAGLKDLLKAKKIQAIRAFDADVVRLGPTHRALKYIKKAKKWLKVKSLGKVLGPLFDAVSVGVNAWSLGTAIRDCNADPEACNPSAMTAASLSIAAGLVGVGTFVATLLVSSTVAAALGPVGAIVSLTLTIVATLIELFWKPGPTQAQIDRELKEYLMRDLDRISRLQLYNANKFLTENDVERSDLYVVNQGHLPKWFSQHGNVIRFGSIEGNKPRRKVPLIQNCNRPVFGNARIPGGPRGGGLKSVCPYLVDGVEFRTTRTNEPLGYGFYGFSKSARTYYKSRVDNLGSSVGSDPPYDGTILLVGTDQVQPSVLSQHENMNARLRGLDLNTAMKNGNDGEFDDLIAIGDMHSLDRGETITVRMGSGNDALNIDSRLGDFGMSNILDAELGPNGHNTLSFDAMPDNSPIKGINYDAKTGVLQYVHGSNNQKQRVGTVRSVEILAASPHDDYIKMYAGKLGEGNFDFTVFKFKGKATYEISIADLASQTETRNFKIVDSTDNGESENNCANHIPVLKLTDFDNIAVENDVLYQDDRIKIYGMRSVSNKKRSIKETFSQKRAHHHSFKNIAKKERKSKKRTTGCSGERSDGSHPEGGKNGKVLLATIALYTKCPFDIQTTNSQGSCMMRTKKKMELDLSFFQGKKMFADFTGDVDGSDGADHCYLRCPTDQVNEHVTIDLTRGSRDRVVIGSEMFLDPCGIDGSNHQFPIAMMRADTNKWMIKFQGVDKFGENGKQHLLQGVEKIINEYGDVVVDLHNTEDNEIDLYSEYAKSTMNRIASIEGNERTSEVRDSLLQCMKEESSMTDEEREICTE